MISLVSWAGQARISIAAVCALDEGSESRLGGEAGSHGVVVHAAAYHLVRARGSLLSVRRLRIIDAPQLAENLVRKALLTLRGRLTPERVVRRHLLLDGEADLVEVLKRGASVSFVGSMDGARMSEIGNKMAETYWIEDRTTWAGGASRRARFFGV